jgi:hypothetical protein
MFFSFADFFGDLNLSMGKSGGYHSPTLAPQFTKRTAVNAAVMSWQKDKSLCISYQDYFKPHNKR